MQPSPCMGTVSPSSPSVLVGSVIAEVSVV
jgi:hypothetical protein